MSLIGWLCGMAHAQPIDTGQTVRAWIAGQNAATLERTEVGRFPTSQSQLVMRDALTRAPTPQWIDVPDTGADIVACHDTHQGRTSKLALIFSDATVTGGAEVGVLAISAGLASVVTPDTFASTSAFFDTFKGQSDPDNDDFSKFDDPQGGARKIVPLPDGTPLPYIHSGWGDGGYAVYALHDMAGDVIAVYTDVMGKNDTGDWLQPPGLKH